MISAFICGSGETAIDTMNESPLHPSVHGVTSNSTVSTTYNGLILSSVPELNVLGAPTPCR